MTVLIKQRKPDPVTLERHDYVRENVVEVKVYNHGIAFNVATINKIDFTEFTTLVATCKAADKNNAAPRSATFAVASTQSGFNNAGTASTKIASTTFSNSTTTVTIDVSGISGSYYVTFVVELSNYNTGTLTVDEVKLMK